ncbi:MAG: hypothetical protein ACKOK8_00350 [Planctomycetia bacterium]
MRPEPAPTLSAVPPFMPRDWIVSMPPFSRLFSAGCRTVLVAAVIAAAPTLLPAADLPPHLMARFTRHVQPLLLNKCAAGACHGGPTAHVPHLNRGDVSGQIDRTVTLANIDTLFGVIGKEGNTRPFLATISARHPASSTGSSLTMVPLTTNERAMLEQWLTAAVRPGDFVAAKPVPAGSPAQTAAAPKPNRFRAMLDAAANPPVLPPPQQPQGVILGKDSP